MNVLIKSRIKIPFIQTFACAALVFCTIGLQEARANASCNRVVSYYPYWAQWNTPVYTSTQIPMGKMTHIEHAFLYLKYPSPNGSISILAGYLEPNLITKAHAAGVKVLASVGGADANMTAAFVAIAASAAFRTTLATQLKSFCDTYGYDGVDIDWEFP